MIASTPSVLIVGEDPAGLTAAYHLAQRGYHVTVIDRHATLGGYSHVAPLPAALMGCHHATWTLLKSLHRPITHPSHIDIPLEFQLRDGRIVRYPDTWFPGPFRPLLNVLRWSAISWSERRQLVSWLERIWEGETELPTNLEQRTADDWLHSLGQSEDTRQAVWNPLARWLTGNDLRTLSAEALATSIRPFFLNSRADNRLTLFPNSLQETLLQPLIQAAIKAGTLIRLDTEAAQLRYAHDRVSGVQLRDGAILEADWYITAVSPQHLTPLLPERWLSRYAYFQQFTELTTTDQTIMQGMADRLLTTPRLMLLSHQPDYSALTIIGDQMRTLFSLATTNSQTRPAQPASNIEAGLADLLRSLKLLSSDTHLKAIQCHTIPNAILPLKPGTKMLRPIQRSPIANLFVAGAWTDTGWPCNLESAIESGNRCARAIQEQ